MAHCSLDDLPKNDKWRRKKMIHDPLIWVSRNIGNKKDKLLLAGKDDEGGYRIACLLDFCLGCNSIKGSQKTKFWQFRQRWERKFKDLIGGE